MYGLKKKISNMDPRDAIKADLLYFIRQIF